MQLSVPNIRRRTGRWSSAVMLAWLPLGLALLGAWVDQQRALGITNWRSACRAAGVSPASVLTFTFELLPTAVIGALLGGLLVLATALSARQSQARSALAAHAGCFAAMPVGLLLCASAWPWPLALGAELLLAALTAAGLWWLMRIRGSTYLVSAARGVSRMSAASANHDNFSVNHLWNSHDCH